MSEREGSQRERGLGPRRKREAFSLGPATTVVRSEGRGPDHREERAQRENVEYGGYYARWYRPRISRFWWLHRRSYLLFVIRELTSVFVAWFVVYLLLLVHAVASGEQEYRRFLDLSANPWMLALNVISLLLVLYHTVTWFSVAPQAMVVRLPPRGVPAQLRGRRVPARVILGVHYLAWAVVTALVAWVILG